MAEMGRKPAPGKRAEDRENLKQLRDSTLVRSAISLFHYQKLPVCLAPLLDTAAPPPFLTIPEKTSAGHFFEKNVSVKNCMPFHEIENKKRVSN